MTDRIKGFVVTLEEDFRVDDVEVLRSAIALLRGVASVSPSITTAEDHMNRERIRWEFRQKIWDVVRVAKEETPAHRGLYKDVNSL